MSSKPSAETTPPPKPVPLMSEGTRPFWEGCKAHKLMIQQCQDCQGWVYYPRVLCTHCHSDRLEWRQASGRGVIYSYTVCHRPAGPAFKGDVPYVVALIDLEEGPRMLSNIRTGDPASVKIGLPVQVVFEPIDDEHTLPKFELVG